MDLLFRGAYLHDPDFKWERSAEILIRGGKVEAVGASLGNVDVPVVHLHGKTLIPGLVDAHVHLREPGEEDKETIATGCAAAVAGGITSLACMPNTLTTVDNQATVAYIREQAEKADLARVYPLGAITRGLQGKELTDMFELAAAGVKGFSDDGRPVMDSGLMLKAMQTAVSLDMPVISHCEDLSIAAAGVIHAGPAAGRLGFPVLRPSAEAAMVARDLLLQEEIRGKLHFAHISSQISVALLKWASEHGIPFSAETTPHHLLLTDEAVEHFAADAKMNPPLREPADQSALLFALRGNLISIIATDHAPHRPSDKEKGLMEAPFGVVGLETALPLLITELVLKGRLSWRRLIESYSLTPARLLNIPGGTLAPGSPADIAIVDLDEKRPVQKDNFYSKGRNTPFEGWKLKGFPVMTMVGGDIKMLYGKVKGFSAEFPACLEDMLAKGTI